MFHFIDSLLLKMRFQQKGILLVSIPLIFEILFVSLLSVSYAVSQEETRLSDHSRRVLSITDAMTTSLFAIGASLFIAPSPDHRMLEAKIADIGKTLDVLVNSLVEETNGFPDESRLVTQIIEATKDLADRATFLKSLVTNPLQMVAQTEVRKARKSAKSSLHKIVESLDELIVYEQSISGPRLIQAQNARTQLHLLLYGGVVLNVLLSIWLAFVFGKQITGRLDTVSSNAIAMSKKQPPQSVVAGEDELADLDHLIHKLSAILIETTRRERAMVDHTVDVICALSPNFNVLTINAAASTQWGWDPESIVDCSILDLILVEHGDRFRKDLELARSSSSGHKFECSLIRADGSLVESAWSVLWSELDQSYFSIVRDIGAEKETDRVRQKFLSMITHDLRGPLANFRSFFEMLQSGVYGKLYEKGEATVQNLEGNIDFLLALTEDLLEIGKLQSGHVVLSLKDVSVETLVDESLSVIESLSLSKSIKITVDLPRQCILRGDFLRLKQILVNLLSNAIKFSPAGSTVTVSIAHLDAVSRITVADEGAGLSLEDCQRVFDLYAQADNQAGASMKGFGLGLSIAKSIVEAHGGRIGAAPRTPNGAEFWFEIPLSVSENAGEPISS